MKTIIYSAMVLFIILVFSFLFTTSKLLIKDDRFKSKLNTKVVLNKDTLTIIDYSFINSNYTLSNGTIISVYVADSISVK